MATVTGLGAAPMVRAFRRCVGFEGYFGRRGGGAEGAFFGGPFLVAQSGFEPNNLLLQPVNDLLFFQTFWTVRQSVQFRID